jgi:hypothetical protein
MRDGELNQTEQTRAFVLDYFDALSGERLQDIPIAADCTYTGSMLSDIIRGGDAVREHIGQIAPFVERFELKRMVVEGADAAVIVDLVGFANRQVEGVVFFEVEDGSLKSMNNLFDTRQLLGSF